MENKFVMTRFLIVTLLLIPSLLVHAQRIRDFGIEPGVMQTGTLNAITDVSGVKVGHVTLYAPEVMCTGVTVILPHDGNLFSEKVPAAVYVGNGFGKLIGSTQIRELGNLETPIVLTNTLSVPMAAQGVMEYMLSVRGNENVRSVNPVVGETNDGFLNDIRGFHVRPEHVVEAILNASGDLVPEGSVGAGTGTVCFGFKGGIGTSSRLAGPYTIGVLVQSNFGGVLMIDGIQAGELLRAEKGEEPGESGADGSCMIVVATDAPLDSRNLERLAKRAMLGLARTGGIGSNGSGDYVIAFSTAPELRQVSGGGSRLTGSALLGNDAMTPLFQATIEATEEAIYNSMVAAAGLVGYRGRKIPVIPIEKILKLYRQSLKRE